MTICLLYGMLISQSHNSGSSLYQYVYIFYLISFAVKNHGVESGFHTFPRELMWPNNYARLPDTQIASNLFYIYISFFVFLHTCTCFDCTDRSLDQPTFSNDQNYNIIMAISFVALIKFNQNRLFTTVLFNYKLVL